MAYEESTVYNKFQPCEDCEPKEDCGCCPPGLVAVYECDKHVGCLTPSDAAQYNDDRAKCGEGYVKAYHPTTGRFLGCVSPADYPSIVNP